MGTKNSFQGLSLLREKEKAEEKKNVTDEAKKLQAYLAAQYGSGSSEPAKKKKKVKKQLKAGGLRIVDEDASGFVQIKGNGAVDEDEDAPVIANPEEAALLKRLVEREKQFYNKTEDGAGWEAINNTSPTASPPRRRQRHDSPDASPPRRRQDSPDASPPRRRQRHDSPPRRRQPTPDASPPRRRHDSPPDASPPRRRRHDSPGPAAAQEDASPPRRRPAADNHDDLSPPRKRKDRSDDEHDLEPHRGNNKHKKDDDGVKVGDGSKPGDIMSDGTRTGFISGRELAAEMQKKREAELKRFASLSAEVTGRDAKTVYRDKTGQQVSKEELLEKQAAEKQKYEDQTAIPWGGGLKQREEAEAAYRRMQEEAAKPFVRGYDKDYDAVQKDRLRFGDPMAHLVKKKQPELDIPESVVAAQEEKLKKAGFVIPLQVPPHSWLRRGVGPPINRYNIKPGRHWDGVLRGNGFEEDMFRRINELQRREREARVVNQGDL